MRNSHKRGHICHHCRLHLALGVVNDVAITVEDNVDHLFYFSHHNFWHHHHLQSPWWHKFIFYGMFGMCQGSYQLSTNWSTQQTGSLSLHIFSQIRFFNSVILPLQFRNSHKGSDIHHHCRLHFALGVFRSPFASRIIATILSHYFLWQHQVLHVDKIYLLYCMHCIL